MRVETEDALASTEQHQGRLELTWTNKDKRLLAHEDGSYEWLSPADYRVAEVRLLDDAGVVGEVGPKTRRAAENLLIRGDALNALTSLTELPEFASEYVGKVRLVYLDPPFNTQQSFLDYDDALEHSVWLTMMRDRLIQIRNLLAPGGSVWVHCDDSEYAYLKVVMDELFGRDNFVATFVWQKTLTRRNDARLVSSAHDYLVVYARDGADLRFNRTEADAKQRATYTNRDNDPRGDWLAIPFHAPNIRPNLTYPITTPGGRVLMPPPGRCWSTTKERFEGLLADSRIYFGRNGNGMAQRKKFWDEDEHSLVPWTWWPYQEAGENREANREAKGVAAFSGSDRPFPTPKPERLLHRIIQIATEPGDVVFDCFLGSGTTAAVAQKMGRRWVGIERSSETLDGYALPRLTNVVEGTDPGGISEAVDWQGGGGFRMLDVAPTMFEADGDAVFIADWASNGKLAEVTAAQLGFEFDTDPPFVGRRGLSRLAVIDGLVNADVARMLAEALPDGELLTLCGTAVDPEARPVLRELRRGSTVRKIPASILADYRSARWQPSVNGSG